jgi:hypothetical protein
MQLKRILSPERSSRNKPTREPQGPSQLLLLADELLLSIVEQIDSQEALHNLAATCSRLRNFAEPKIWRSVLVTRGEHAEQVAQAMDSPIRIDAIHELAIRYDHHHEGMLPLFAA